MLPKIVLWIIKVITSRGVLTDVSAKTKVQSSTRSTQPTRGLVFSEGLTISVTVLAEISLRSPRKLFIFTKKKFSKITVSKRD